jgi:hypothetical protein
MHIQVRMGIFNKTIAGTGLQPEIYFEKTRFINIVNCF